MKSRVKSNGGIVHPDFEDFKTFMDVMGFPPSDNHTLDRIDNSRNEYTPENCRWASKREQSANRQNTILLVIDGIKKPLTDWAEETNQKPNTLRSRHHKGWSDEEVIFGRENSFLPTRKKRQNSNTSFSSQEIRKFKNASVHKCHSSLKWPWLSETAAKRYEREYLDTSRYPETRYEYYERSSLRQLTEINASISELSSYKIWLMDPKNYKADQLEAIYEIKNKYDLSEQNIANEATKQLALRRVLKEQWEQMLRYKEIEGPFHHQGFRQQ